MALNRSGAIGTLQAMLVPVAGVSDRQVVSTTQVNFDTTMAATDMFVFTCDVDSYIKQGATPVASAGDGSMLVPAGMPLLIDGAQGAKLSIIRKGAVDGVATLQKVVALV